MRRTILVLTLVTAMLLACTGVVLAQTTPPANSPSDTPTKAPKDKKIAGSYIVVLKDDADPDQVAKKKQQEIGGLKIKKVYKAALKGFAVEIPDEKVSELRNNPEVDYVEQDQEMKAVDQTLPWGIQQIAANQSQTAQIGDNKDDVAGVKAYIIDTGIDGSHTDLNVENPAAKNTTGDGKDYDCAGHGTHVAGTVAAKDNASDVVGTVSGIPLVGVKVLNCSGSGTTSGVIAGVDWVTQNATRPAVANMSLGGGASDALDTAVRNSAKEYTKPDGTKLPGIFYSIAAGNSGANACNYSPARAGRTKNSDGTWNKNNGVMTTAATDRSDKEAYWSNYGNCVDIWAPGVSILSTKMGGGTTTMSGTSMAAPHVGGGGALYLYAHRVDNPSALDVEKALKSASKTTTNKSKDGKTIMREDVHTF